MLSNEPPFVALPSTTKGIDEESEEPFEPEPESVDFPIRCPPFETTGSCRLGLKCRFLGGHMRKAEDGTVSLAEDEEKKRASLTANTELNFVSPSTLKLLRTKKVSLYFFPSYSKCEIKQRSIPHQSLTATFRSSRWQAAVRMARRTTTICP